MARAPPLTRPAARPRAGDHRAGRGDDRGPRPAASRATDDHVRSSSSSSRRSSRSSGGGSHATAFPRRPDTSPASLIGIAALWAGGEMIMTLLYGFVLIPSAGVHRAPGTVLCLGTGAALLLLVFRLADHSDPDPVVEQPATLSAASVAASPRAWPEGRLRPRSMARGAIRARPRGLEAPWRRQRSRPAADRPSLRPSLRLRRRHPRRRSWPKLARSEGARASSRRRAVRSSGACTPAPGPARRRAHRGVRGQPRRARPRRDRHAAASCAFGGANLGRPAATASWSRSTRPACVARSGRITPDRGSLARICSAPGGSRCRRRRLASLLGGRRRTRGGVRRRAALARAAGARAAAPPCGDRARGRAARSAARRLHVSAGHVTERYRSWWSGTALVMERYRSVVERYLPGRMTVASAARRR